MERWPLEEMLLAYLAIARAEASHAYDLTLQRWAVLAPYQTQKPKPPRPPAMLKFDYE